MSRRDQFRKRFKATELNVLEEQDKQVAKVVGGGSGNIGMHKPKNGNNFYRIAPAHEDTPSFVVPLCMSFVPFIDDSGNQKKRPVFNARVHGKEGENKLDIIEEYIRIATKLGADMFQDEKDLEEHLKYINGYWGDKFNGGIKPSTKHVCYAWDIQNGKMNSLQRLTFNYTLKSGLNTICAGIQEVGVEPFTDIDDGVPINIVIDDKAKGKDKYSVSFASIEKSFPTPVPLTDQQLEEFDRVDSLGKIYIGVYDATTFERAVEGLQIFDEEHEYEIFENDEFQQILGELNDLYKVEEEGENDNADLSKMDRSELKRYIKENKLDIRVTRSKSDAALRNEIANYSANVEEEEELEEESIPTVQDQEVVDEEDGVDMSDLNGMFSDEEE